MGPIFARRQQHQRTALVSVRVSLIERDELARLAHAAGASISDILRDGLAQALRSRAGTEAEASKAGA